MKNRRKPSWYMAYRYSAIPVISGCFSFSCGGGVVADPRRPRGAVAVRGSLEQRSTGASASQTGDTESEKPVRWAHQSAAELRAAMSQRTVVRNNILQT